MFSLVMATHTWSNLAQWSALVGFLLPLLIAVVQKAHWSRPVKTIVGILGSLAASIVTPAVYSQLTWDTWATSFILIFVASLTTYRNVWVPVGAAPWIEANVLGGKNPRDRAAPHATR